MKCSSSTARSRQRYHPSHDEHKENGCRECGNSPDDCHTQHLGGAPSRSRKFATYESAFGLAVGLNLLEVASSVVGA